MSRENEQIDRNGVERLINSLIAAGKGDPLFRDLYLERARTSIGPLLSLDQYKQRAHTKQELEILHHQSQEAVERNDWQQAREYAVRIAAAQSIVTENEALIRLGSEVYDAPDVVLDPFSPGLHGLAGNGERSPAELRERLIQQFDLLEQEDREWEEFYRSRKQHFSMRLHPGPTISTDTETIDPEQLRREALQAVERGDVARFDHLMNLLHEEQPQVKGVDENKIATEEGEGATATRPIPEDAVRRSRDLGFSLFTLPPAPEAAAYLNRHAWQPAGVPPQYNPDGSIRLPDLPAFTQFPPETAARLAEIIGLFTIHPFINSAGVRYLPQCMEEQLLVEDYAEGDGAGEGSKLLEILGLPRRWGLSRSLIEHALFTHGPTALRQVFQLDPRQFRLLCIPADAYCRLGRSQSWGLQPYWTHFDGYQVLQNGSIRALVGGDVRYGGMFDLCSISRNDERQGVTVRFAVVKRGRLGL